MHKHYQPLFNLKLQLEKNLNDYEDDDLTDPQMQAVVNVTYQTLRYGQKNNYPDQLFMGMIASNLQNIQSIDALLRGYQYLMQRARSKYGSLNDKNLSQFAQNVITKIKELWNNRNNKNLKKQLPKVQVNTNGSLNKNFQVGKQGSLNGQVPLRHQTSSGRQITIPQTHRVTQLIFSDTKYKMEDKRLYR